MKMWVLNIYDADDYIICSSFRNAVNAAWNYLTKDLGFWFDRDFKDACCDEYIEGESFLCREVYECYPVEFEVN